MGIIFVHESHLGPQEMRVKVHVWKTILTKDHSDSGAQDELGEIVKWLLLRLCCVSCLFCPFLWGNGTLLFRAFNPISKQFRVYVNYSLSQEVRSLSTCASKCWQSISFSPVNILSCILVFFPLTCDILFLDQRLEKPLLIGEWGPKVQVPEVWLPAG